MKKLEEKKGIKIVSGFFNRLVNEIDKKYFPDVKYYRDNASTIEIHYAVELFNNGCFTYERLINKLSKACKDTKQNIHLIVSMHIEDFGKFEYKA